MCGKHCHVRTSVAGDFCSGAGLGLGSVKETNPTLFTAYRVGGKVMFFGEFFKSIILRHSND